MSPGSGRGGKELEVRDKVLWWRGVGIGDGGFAEPQEAIVDDVDHANEIIQVNGLDDVDAGVRGIAVVDVCRMA